jgi:hypothetical protein
MCHPDTGYTFPAEYGGKSPFDTPAAQRDSLRRILVNQVTVSSQYLGVGADFAPAQAGNRKGLPLLFEKIQVTLVGSQDKLNIWADGEHIVHVYPQTGEGLWTSQIADQRAAVRSMQITAPYLGELPAARQVPFIIIPPQ